MFVRHSCVMPLFSVTFGQFKWKGHKDRVLSNNDIQPIKL